MKDIKPKITQCPESGAVYIQITKNKIKKTVEVGKLTLIDLDYKDRVRGIEMLDFPGKLMK